MQYFGGKARIAKEIARVLEQYRKKDQLYIEPFVGAGWVLSQISGKREASDKHPYLISMYKALQNGWTPPKEVSEEEYSKAKNGNCEDHLRGFIGFGCSFSGKWFGGYARSGSRNYCLNAHNSLMKKLENIKDVTFQCKSFEELTPEKSLIYCDPPYKGTTQYGKLVGDFDSEVFWDKMRNWSEANTVIISEYNAPDDFEEIWRKEVKTDIRNKNNVKEDRLEKLFIHKSKIN